MSLTCRVAEHSRGQGMSEKYTYVLRISRKCFGIKRHEPATATRYITDTAFDVLNQKQESWQ
jgi:hypothetical protein